MIEVLDGLPDALIGFEMAGKLNAEEYRDVLLPVIERAVEAGDVRAVIVIDDFGGLTPGALWEDLQMGVHSLHAWKRIALVSDIEWINHMAAMFGWMTPGELKRFSLADKDAAIAWAAG